MSDLISRRAAIEAVHKSIYDFFDICDDDEESPMTHKDELLLELNKAITTQIKAVASAQPIEAEPKRGRWLIYNILDYAKRPTGRKVAECSVCGQLTPDFRLITEEPNWNYCPNCGAKMDLTE